VDRCIAVKAIVDEHLNLIASADSYDRPKDWRRVSVGLSQLSPEKCVMAAYGVELHPISVRCGIDEFGNRKWRSEGRTICCSNVRAANETARDYCC
jgi:hypothetical protein